MLLSTSKHFKGPCYMDGILFQHDVVKYFDYSATLDAHQGYIFLGLSSWCSGLTCKRLYPAGWRRCNNSTSRPGFQKTSRSIVMIVRIVSSSQISPPLYSSAAHMRLVLTCKPAKRKPKPELVVEQDKRNHHSSAEITTDKRCINI